MYAGFGLYFLQINPIPMPALLDYIFVRPFRFLDSKDLPLKKKIQRCLSTLDLNLKRRQIRTLDY